MSKETVWIFRLLVVLTYAVMAAAVGGAMWLLIKLVRWMF